MTDIAPVNRVPFIAGLVIAAGVLFYFLSPILGPFVVGGLIAYLGDPLVDRLEERGYSRTGGVVMVFLLFTLIIVLLLSLFVPMLLSQLDQLIRAIPDAYSWLSREALPWLQHQLSVSPVKLPPIDWEAELAAHWQSLGKFTAGTIKKLTSSGAAVVFTLLNLAIVPVVAFYLMRDWDDMVAKALDLIPRAWQQNISLMLSEADDVLGAFFRGQLMVMFAQGIIYSIGLWFVGLNFAFILGSIAGLASIIPYAGAVIGVGASLGVAYFQYVGELTPLLWVGAVFGFGQVLEAWVLTPMLIGDRIGLHPVAVIFALMAGGELAGFTGMLVALPVAAVLVVFIRHGIDYYRNSETYQRD